MRTWEKVGGDGRKREEVGGGRRWRRRWEEEGGGGRREEGGGRKEDTHKNNQLPWPPVMRRLARVLLSFFGSWLALGPLPNNKTTTTIVVFSMKSLIPNF